MLDPRGGVPEHWTLKVFGAEVIIIIIIIIVCYNCL